MRLIQARRLMMWEGVSASSAAFSVGYESVQQFTREYRRMFGLPPGKDTDATRSAVSAYA
ncbi:helix-turn-helix domain-containing protein [Paraburkholderia sp. 32]|uniref:helix-turn-helix domain-containing protein n=1 Tax=Paraburkholderia sp. 32 TaxID=2991057 RepID=UPI003D2054E7